jgi:hypothetical protein
MPYMKAAVVVVTASNTYTSYTARNVIICIAEM